MAVVPCNTPALLPTGHPNMGGPMQRMNPPRGMGPMGPGPQVSPGPELILQTMGTTSWGSEGWEFPPTPCPPISVNVFYIRLASGNPSF